MRPLDALIVAALWAGAYLGTVSLFREGLRRDYGLVLTFQEAVLAQGVDVAVWLALMVPLFRAFDGAPLALQPCFAPWPAARRRRLARALVVRGLALAAFGAVHALACWALDHTLGPLLGVSAQVLAHPVLSLEGELRDGFSKLLPPVLTYWVLGAVAGARARARHAAETADALRRASEQALAAQLQPHFLFNALNGIALLVRTEPRQAERMLVRLSTLLRETLEAGRRGTHTLADELALLEHYLAVQRMRFGERLGVTIDVPGPLRAATVPALILQPVVENAIKHGLEAKPSGGTIAIWARVESAPPVPGAPHALVLGVDDDGVGLDAPRDATWEDRRATGELRANGAGIGLANTRARLQLAAGGTDADDGDPLRLEPRDGGGVRVTLRLPLTDPVFLADGRAPDGAPEPTHRAVPSRDEASLRPPTPAAHR